jgi:hypothetical protein
MSSAQIAALRRLAVIVASWAATEALLRAGGMHELATPAGAAAAIAAFFLTRNARPGPRRKGDVIYWRGRKIDRGDWN